MLHSTPPGTPPPPALTDPPRIPNRRHPTAHPFATPTVASLTVGTAGEAVVASVSRCGGRAAAADGVGAQADCGVKERRRPGTPLWR